MLDRIKSCEDVFAKNLGIKMQKAVQISNYILHGKKPADPNILIPVKLITRDHLRSVNQELLSLSKLDLSMNDSKAIHRHDLEHLLLPDLLRRSHIVHHVLGRVYAAMLVLIVDMFIITTLMMR